GSMCAGSGGRAVRRLPRSVVARARAGGYVVRVWIRSLAGCVASGAALRRLSALLSVRQRECCFRLAEARPRALPLPGAEVDHARRKRAGWVFPQPARFISSTRSASAVAALARASSLFPCLANVSQQPVPVPPPPTTP